MSNEPVTFVDKYKGKYRNKTFGLLYIADTSSRFIRDFYRNCNMEVKLGKVKDEKEKEIVTFVPTGETTIEGLLLLKKKYQRNLGSSWKGVCRDATRNRRSFGDCEKKDLLTN